MKKYAVFGNPVLHSRSPQLFNAAFAQLGIDAHYTRVRPENAAQIVQIIRSFPLQGANITTPFKSDIIPYLQYVSPEAFAIGGVNTVVNGNGELRGYNTDYLGVTQSLIEAGCELSKCRCLVLGAGPAARAAIYGLTHAGASVVVANRTQLKAQHIAHDFGCEVIDVDSAKFHLSTFQVVVSALLPEVNLLNGAKLLPSQVLLDANYRQSAFSRYATAWGCSVISGQRWLLHQAVAAFGCLFGSCATLTAMEQAFNIEFDINELSIEPLSSENIKADLLIPDSINFKNIVDEEVGKAFGN